MNSTGKLLSEPEFWLGNSGNVRASQNTNATAKPAITKNVVRQPIASPSSRPSGIPKTIASEVPVANKPSACTCLPSGARRTANDAVMDQNSAWDNATPIRLSIRMPKLDATLDSTWLAINMPKRINSNLRRSTLRVSNMIGSEVSDTTHA